MAQQAKILSGKPLASRIREDTCRRVAELGQQGKHVRVGVVLASAEPAACLYVGRQCRRFGEAGVTCVPQELSGDVSEQEVLEAIAELNSDPSITGVVVALPLPPGLNVKRVQEAIQPAKDVEGVHPHNLGMVALGKRGVGPSTAQAVLELMEASRIDFRGREAVVVGHSEIVGKPVALGLMERLATVTVCHVATRDLALHTRRAEILVVAVGRPGLITGDMVREGALVVDVGINRVTGPDGTARLVGDVDFEAVSQRAGWITPVPGGVGPVTVAVLLRNAMNCACAVGG